MERRLAATLAADAVGYSRMMRKDEPGTLAFLKSGRHHRSTTTKSSTAGSSNNA